MEIKLNMQSDLLNIQLIQVGSPTFDALIQMVAREATEATIRLLNSKKSDEEWVGPKEALKILGCGNSKFQILRDQNKIIFTKERRPRYKVSSLKEYLESNSK